MLQILILRDQSSISVVKHGQTASDVMSCSPDTERRPVGCRTGNVKGTKVRSILRFTFYSDVPFLNINTRIYNVLICLFNKVCFCDGDSCNARDIPDIADPDPAEIAHGEPDKTDGNAAVTTTTSTVLGISIAMAMGLML